MLPVGLVVGLLGVMLFAWGLVGHLGTSEVRAPRVDITARYPGTAHSRLSASAGLTRQARRAGRRLASVATATIPAATAANTAGPRGDT